MRRLNWAKIEAKLDALDARIAAIIGRAQQPRKSRAMSGDVEDAPALALGVVDGAVDTPPHHVLEDRSRPRHALAVQNNSSVKVRRVKNQHVTIRMRERWHDSKHWDDTVVDAKLAAMLERSCSLRGYDGDDSV